MPWTLGLIYDIDGVSTLYTKQHYLVDMVGGIAIACVAYALFLHRHDRQTIPTSDVRLAPRRAMRIIWTYAAVIAVFVTVYSLR